MKKHLVMILGLVVGIQAEAQAELYNCSSKIDSERGLEITIHYQRVIWGSIQLTTPGLEPVEFGYGHVQFKRENQKILSSVDSHENPAIVTLTKHSVTRACGRAACDEDGKITQTSITAELDYLDSKAEPFFCYEL